MGKNFTFSRRRKGGGPQKARKTPRPTQIRGCGGTGKGTHSRKILCHNYLNYFGHTGGGRTEAHIRLKKHRVGKEIRVPLLGTGAARPHAPPRRALAATCTSLVRHLSVRASNSGGTHGKELAVGTRNYAPRRDAARRGRTWKNRGMGRICPGADNDYNPSSSADQLLDSYRYNILFY